MIILLPPLSVGVKTILNKNISFIVLFETEAGHKAAADLNGWNNFWEMEKFDFKKTNSIKSGINRSNL